MKKKLKAVALLSLITVVFSLTLNAIPVAALDESPALETPLQRAMELAQNAKAGVFKTTLAVDSSFDFEQMHDYLWMLYPEHYALSWTVRSGVADVQLVFSESSRTAEARTLAEELVAEHITADMSARQKLLALHDLLIERCEYDYDAAMNLSITRDAPFTAYGALVEGKAVCDGYAAAFWLLCDVAGIPCLGIASQEMNHSWNAVLCEGEIWYIDATYSDTGGAAHFMMTQDQLQATHTWDRSAAQAVFDAVWTKGFRAALTLQQAGLMQGSDKGFELERTPKRYEAAYMLARLTGLEGSAGSHPFTDVAASYADTVGALYEAGLMKGVSDTLFAPDAPVTAPQYVTLALRALGYGEGADFTYGTVMQDAVKLGILNQEEVALLMASTFDRGCMAWVTEKILAATAG